VTKLTTADVDVGGAFGISVSISGDIAIVGTGEGPPTRGSVYVFARNQGGTNAWGQVTRLMASDGMPGDAFGLSVSISDAIAIVGAPNLEAAYVFRRDLGGPNAWGEVAKFTASDASGPIQFGESVSVSGGSAIVGAVAAPGSGGSHGAAYLFTRAAEDDWRQTQKLLPGGLAARTVSHFGLRVALDGTRAVVVGSDFSITATFTNASSIPIPMPFFDVVELTGGNLLANADEEPGAEGATLTPDVGDGVLSPGEPVTVTFVIRLKTFDPFRFLVRIRGEVPAGDVLSSR
jgi:hypothetical protein